MCRRWPESTIMPLHRRNTMSSNPDLDPENNPDGDRGEFDFPREPEFSESPGKPHKSRRPVTDKTAVKYRRNFGMMVERAAASLNLDPDLVTISDLIEQLRNDKTLTTATKVTYQASIDWALRQPDIEFPQESRERGLELIGALKLRDQQIVRNTRVSARAIPKEDLGAVLN